MESPQRRVDLDVEMAGDVVIVRFADDVVLSGQQAEIAGERLRTLLTDTDRPRLLIDFANVVSLTSIMLGKLAQLHRVAESAGGRIALCNLPPVIRQILEVSQLSQILDLYDNEREALEGL